jgi:hypothetical protein
LRFIGFSEHDAVVVLGLYAEYSAGGHDGMVDFRDAAIGTRQHEIVQHVLAAGFQGSSYAVLAEPRNEVVCDLRRRLSENECEKESAADREHEHRRTHARNPGGNGRLRCNRGQRDQRQAREQRS